MMSDYRNHPGVAMLASTLAGIVGLSVLVGAVLAVAETVDAAELGQCPGAHRHTVVAGDTLGAIARANGRTVAELATWNEIPNPDLIAVGDSVCLMPPSSRLAALAEVVTEVEAADHCVGGPRPGAIAFLSAMEARFDVDDLGIYNCRNARGGESQSTHAEGRAVDLGTDGCTAEGYAAAEVSARMPGVGRVVYCDREWRADLDGDGWRTASPSLASWHGYTPDGSPPKAPAHVHVELTSLAADWLTVDDYITALDLLLVPVLPEFLPTFE